MAQPRVEVHSWGDIEADFNDSLIVGNGGSISVSPGFSYRSLHDLASQDGRLSAAAVDVFDRFGTSDFELVLRRLWQTTVVNQAFGLPDGPVEEGYRQVRTALIETIRATHIGYAAALPSLTPIYRFMQRFHTVLSLNYDLLVYWAAMLGNDALGNWFKDGFQGPIFSHDWRRFRDPYGAEGATLLFYPHGHLALARTARGNEIKIHAGNADLLQTIIDKWTSGTHVPLFVSEGITERKQQAIAESRYLRSVFNGPFDELGATAVIYGWGFGRHDAHILNALGRQPPQTVAVSVHAGDVAFALAARQQLESAGVETVVFFDAASPGCWNHR